MAQADYVVSNGTGAAVRADLNGQLAAIVTNNSGATSPATTYAYQWWADTTTNTLKLRNSANSAWIEIMQLDGTLTMEDGTAALPGLAFRDDLDTGIFRAGTNQLGISSAGVERVEFGSSEVVFNDAGNNYDFRVEGDTNANLLFVDASADAVGIGTSSPGSLLQVGTGALSSTNIAAFLGGSTTFENVTTGNNPSITFNNDTDTGILNPSANTLGINTGGNRAITIDSSQRVGIGTQSPASILHVSGSGDQTYTFQTTSSGADNRINFRNSSGTDAGGIWYMHNGNHLLFNTGGSNGEKARIDSSGRLLVGTSSAINDAHTFTRNVNNSAFVVANETASGNVYGLQVRFAQNPNNTTSNFIECYGNTSTALKFQVYSNGGIANFSANNSNLSDRNAKKDISPAADTWNCIKEWEIVNYRYKDQPDDADLNLGVIAQQVAESCPEVITVFQEAKEATEDQPAQEERLGVKEQQMYWMAIKALQEAQIRIETLEAKVAALESV